MNKNVELKYCDPPKPSTPYEGRKDLEVLAQVFWKGELLMEVSRWTDIEDLPIMIYTTWPMLRNYQGNSEGYADVTPAVADALKAADEIEKFLHQKFCMPKVKREGPMEAAILYSLDKQREQMYREHQTILMKTTMPLANETDDHLMAIWLQQGGTVTGEIHQKNLMPALRALANALQSPSKS